MSKQGMLLQIDAAIDMACSFKILMLTVYSQRIKLTTKIHDEYDEVRKLPEALVKQQNEAMKNAQRRTADQGSQAKKTTLEEVIEDNDVSNSSVQQLIDSIPEKSQT
jgi:pleiotropic regulator 1